MPTPRPRIRLFVDAPLSDGASVPMNAAQAHYVGRVMRAAPDDPLVLFNGRDGEWAARIGRLGRGDGVMTVRTEIRPQQAEPGPWLGFAPLKKAALDVLIGKATELGVARLSPVITARTHAERVNVDRLRAQTVEAAEQCRRLTVPGLDPPASLTAFTGCWPPDRRLLLLDETGGDRPLVEAIIADPDGAPAPPGILVGPEGGFAPAELDALRKLPFVTAVGLGPRILRAETAAVAALACWQMWCGDRTSPTALGAPPDPDTHA